MKKYNIGIVGYGDFTKLMLEYMSPFADIVVSSRKQDFGDAGFGASFAPNKEVLSCPIIILSIPAQFISEFLDNNYEYINDQAIVIDVCSVKVKPLDVMVAKLPANCSIIGTHPMFGPASVKKNMGIKNLKCVVSAKRADEKVLNDLMSFLSQDLGLEVIKKTADQHDREMAYVQGLSHYLGRVMDIMNIPDSELSTLAYDDLLDMKRIQGGDSWDLFESIMDQNPYAREVNQKFKDACGQLDIKLG